MPVKSTKSVQIKNGKFDEATGIFEGYASVFGNVDSDGDMIERGAFSEFLAQGWQRVKILALHNDQWLPIGKPLELYEDDVGLYIKAKIVDTSLGCDVLKLLKEGVIDEMSVGFILLDSWIDDQGIQHITEIELLEVSLVTWAANSLAKVLDVKSKGDTTEAGINKLQDEIDALEKSLNNLKYQLGKLKPKTQTQTVFGIKSRIQPRRKNHG